MSGKTEAVFTKRDTLAAKGTAILLMLFHHLFLSGERFQDYEVTFFPFSENSVVELAKLCKICVGIFVILSGYGLTISLKKYSEDTCISGRQYRQYLKTRLLKLMWGFWLIYLLSVLVSLVGFPYQIQRYFEKDGITGFISGITYMIIDFLGLAELLGTPTLCGTWWYMSLAVEIVLLVPFLCRACKKYGSLFVMLSCIFLPRVFMLEGESSNMIRWSFALVLGVIAAQNDWLAKLKNMEITGNPSINLLVKFILFTVLLMACLYVSYIYGKGMGKYTYEFRHGVVPFLVIAWVYLCVANLPGIGRCLVFWGKHSMNIFLTHTFIRHYYFEQWTYSFGNFLAIFIALLVSSLLVSLVIEFIKKILRYERLLAKILSIVR